MLNAAYTKLLATNSQEHILMDMNIFTNNYNCSQYPDELELLVSLVCYLGNNISWNAMIEQSESSIPESHVISVFNTLLCIITNQRAAFNV